jgi:hypothetical protein
MKRYLIFFLLLFTIFDVPAQIPLLASVETNYNTPPPAEKRKIKKKKRQKRHFKKSNRIKDNRRRSIKKGLAVSFIIFAALGYLIFIAYLTALLPATLLTALIGTILIGIALIFLIAFLLYKAPKKKEAPLLKLEKASRAEVAHLEEKDILAYLALNKELTMLNVRKNALLRNKRENNHREWIEIKKTIKALEVKIERIKIQMNEFRHQNKINKVLKSRN